MEKRYKVTSISGMMSTRTEEYIGTLKELAKELRLYLGGVTPRKPESMVKRLNDSQNGKYGTYTYKTFFIEECE